MKKMNDISIFEFLFSRETKLNASNINSVTKGLRNLCGDYIWERGDE